MTPGNGISGVRGDVLLGTTPISEIKKWSWSPKCVVKDYASNKTGGARKRVPGTKDGSGSIDGVWDPWNPICTQIDVGSIVTLTLQHTTGQTWTVPAIIETMKYDVDLDSGDIEGWSADYSICGMWTSPVAQPATTAGFLPFAGALPQEQARPLFGQGDTSQPPYPTIAQPGEADPLRQPLAQPLRGPEAWQGQPFPTQPVAPTFQAANTSPFGQASGPGTPAPNDPGTPQAQRLNPDQFKAITEAVLAALAPTFGARQQAPVR